MSRPLVRHERMGGWERAGRGVKKEETEGSRGQEEYIRHKESFFILADWFSTQPAEKLVKSVTRLGRTTSTSF